MVMEYVGSFFRKLAVLGTVGAFSVGAAYGQWPEKKERIVYPTSDGVSVVDGSKSYHIQFGRKTPRDIFFRDKNNPQTFYGIHQSSRTHATAKRYNPDEQWRTFLQQLELQRNRNRVIRIPRR